MPFGVAAGIGAIGSIGSSLISGNAANNAAQLQSNAARQANAVQRSEFNQTQANLAPYITGGGLGLSALLNMLRLGATGGGPSMGQPQLNLPPVNELGNVTSNYATALQGATDYLRGALPTFNTSETEPSLKQFRQSPGYQYVLNQSRNAAQNSAAGQTGNLSSNMLAALQRNAAGLSDQDYQNFVNQWNLQNTNAYNSAFNKATSNYNALINAAQGNFGAGTGLYNADVQSALNQYNAGTNNWINALNALQNLSGSGQNAAAMLGGFGQNLAGAIGSNLGTAATAQGAGGIATANAFNQGISNLSNNLLAPPPNINNSLLGQIFGLNNNANNYNNNALLAANYGGPGFGSSDIQTAY